MHAMLAGYTSFENAMKQLTGLLGENLSMGPDRDKTLIDRPAEPESARPSPASAPRSTRTNPSMPGSPPARRARPIRPGPPCGRARSRFGR